MWKLKSGWSSQQLYYHDCSGRIPGHTTRVPQVGFELETNGFQFYAIATLDNTSNLLHATLLKRRPFILLFECSQYAMSCISLWPNHYSNLSLKTPCTCTACSARTSLPTLVGMGTRFDNNFATCDLLHDSFPDFFQILNSTANLQALLWLHLSYTLSCKRLRGFSYRASASVASAIVQAPPWLQQ